MARINLLTIHYGQCYGAVMQTYATCRLLEKEGHIVRVINLISPRQKGNWKTLRFWKDCISEFQFWLFKRKYFSKLTNKAYSIDDINLPDADVTIVGSDQVWNRDITGDFGKTFFLDYVKGQRKIALSSSFGKEQWVEDYTYTHQVRDLLSQFNAISVREQTGVKIVNDVFGLNAVNLVDPTLGYGNFDDLVLSNTHIRQVFPFLLLNDSNAIEKAKFIAEQLQLPLFRHSRLSAKIFSGPRSWLTNIKNSDFIITDSFHGLALSIIFRRQFFVFCASEAKFTRLKSLLCLLGLESRYVESIEDFLLRKDELIKPINYDDINYRLDIEMKRYRNFIKENI